jgi:hypothetical protein
MVIKVAGSCQIVACWNASSSFNENLTEGLIVNLKV